MQDDIFRQKLDDCTEVREAYGYIKRWVRVRGLSKVLHDGKILKLVSDMAEDARIAPSPLEFDGLIEMCPKPSSLAFIQEFFVRHARDSDPLIFVDTSTPLDLPYGMEDWEEMLVALDKLHFRDKMVDCSEFVLFNVTYSGPSRVKRCGWTSMLRVKMTELEESKLLRYLVTF